VKCSIEDLKTLAKKVIISSKIFFFCIGTGTGRYLILFGNTGTEIAPKWSLKTHLKTKENTIIGMTEDLS
jgi:hypothetical protein